MAKPTFDGLPDLEPKKLIFGVLQVLANKIQVVADKKGDDISLKQWLLLIMITQFENESPTLTEVAEFMGSSRQNVKQLALKLQAKGFLNIEKSKKDGRVLKLSIRQECMAYFEEKMAYQDHFLELLYQGLNQGELACMATGLSKLMFNIDKMEELINGGYEI